MFIELFITDLKDAISRHTKHYSTLYCNSHLLPRGPLRIQWHHLSVVLLVQASHKNRKKNTMQTQNQNNNKMPTTSLNKQYLKIHKVNCLLKKKTTFKA